MTTPAPGLISHQALAWALAETAFTVSEEEAREIVAFLADGGYCVAPRSLLTEAAAVARAYGLQSKAVEITDYAFAVAARLSESAATQGADHV